MDLHEDIHHRLADASYQGKLNEEAARLRAMMPDEKELGALLHP